MSVGLIAAHACSRERAQDRIDRHRIARASRCDDQLDAAFRSAHVRVQGVIVSIPDHPLRGRRPRDSVNGTSEPTVSATLSELGRMTVRFRFEPGHGSQLYGCRLIWIRSVAVCLLSACTAGSLRPVSFNEAGRKAVVHFGRNSPNSDQEPESRRICLAELRDAHGAGLAVSQSLPSRAPLELNPGVYELVLVRCVLPCSKKLSHSELLIETEGEHSYRVSIEHEVNIIESVSLQIAVRDETTGDLVASADGGECEWGPARRGP